jgi:hypothetical protein
MKHGKVLYPDACGPKGNPKSQGGGSTGKRTKFKGGAETPMIKNEGTPRDKGVNR